MRLYGLILCSAVVLVSGRPQWTSGPRVNDWGQQYQQLRTSFYQDQLSALGIYSSDHQTPIADYARDIPSDEFQVAPDDYVDPSAYEVAARYQPPELGFPASNYREAPTVYAEEQPMAPITRRRVGQKAPLSDVWRRNEKKLNRNADLSWPDFFNFNAFEGTRHTPAMLFEKPQVEEIYAQPQLAQYADPAEVAQILQPENPFPQHEISKWYSNNYGDEQAYVPDLTPHREPEPAEPPKNIQDQVDIIKKEKINGTGLLNLLRLTGPSKAAQNAVDRPKTRNEAEGAPPAGPEVPDLRGHRLQPKRSLMNTVKILMGIPPVYETFDEHMKRHQQLRGRMDEELVAPKIWGHTILNLLTNGRWSGNLWYPVGSDIWK